MVEESFKSRRSLGCGSPLKACAVIVGICLVLLIFLIVWILRLPGVKDILQCRTNMAEIGAALERYRDVTGSYPSGLNALRSEYLKESSVLRCPLDSTNTQEPSYAYTRPAPDTRADFVVLQCDRHRLRPGSPKSRLILLKSGEVKAVAGDTRRRPAGQ